MEIKHIQTDNKGSFKAIKDGNQVGEMTYVFAGEKRFIIDHTEVDEQFNGQGVGLKMVMSAVEYARENELKILPLCPFAKSVFDKRQEIHDVLS
ncbi:MAG: GNAT family N-acetyltransferase [Bacteroidota bacterium]